jgi:hypothetical protein
MCHRCQIILKARSHVDDRKLVDRSSITELFRTARHQGTVAGLDYPFVNTNLPGHFRIARAANRRFRIESLQGRLNVDQHKTLHAPDGFAASADKEVENGLILLHEAVAWI